MTPVCMDCRIVVDACSQYTMILNHALIEGLFQVHTFNASRYSLMNNIPDSAGLASQVYDHNSLINKTPGCTGLASQVYDFNEFILPTLEYIISRGIYTDCQFDSGV